MLQGTPERPAVAASHSCAVLSPLPVRIVLPSGLNATDDTGSGCSMGGPRGRPVAASHSRAVLSWLPVRTVLPSGLNATDQTAVRMHQGLADGPAAGGVPQPRRVVKTGGEDRLAVGAERH